MDRVRFGRALGKGARLAARTAVEAAQAAAAPAAQDARSNGTSPRPSAPPQPQILRPVGTMPQPSVRRSSTAAHIGPAVKAAGTGMLGPLRGASRALWHEFTGSFFALFALSFVLGSWKTRAGAFSAVPSDRHHFYEFCGLALLFGYFSVSSFLRARNKPAR